jgi:hypothetical protein
MQNKAKHSKAKQRKAKQCFRQRNASSKAKQSKA